MTCRVPVQRAQCEVELIGMNGALTVQGSNHLNHDFWIRQSKAVDGAGKKAEREIEGRSKVEYDPQAGHGLLRRIGEFHRPRRT